MISYVDRSLGHSSKDLQRNQRNKQPLPDI